MPRKDDIRFDRRPVKLDHKSARGTVFRNFGAFTRGSQLVRMRYTVMLDGFKWPAITALGSCQSASKRDPLLACKRGPPGGVALG